MSSSNTILKGQQPSSTQETLKVPKVSVYGLSEEESLDVCQLDMGET